ncbi:MAG: VWA domain-containing protein [Desulfurococcales archaeon]|nr:VWA domain-containing protein [Desulfurococcales archaeon]
MPGVLRGVNYSSPVARYRGESIVTVARKLRGGVEKEGLTIDLAIDVFYSLYLPYPILKPVSEVGEELERNYYVIKGLVESDDAAEIRKHTVTNTSLSSLVSASLVDLIIKELRKEGQGQGEGSGEGPESQSVMNAVRRAVRQAVKEVAYIRRLEQLLGRGDEAGVGSRMDFVEEGEEVIKLARNADVRDLLEYFTQVPDVIRSIRRKYERFSRGEIRGYEVGSDLERVVPTELVLPDIYFQVKFMESKLLLFEKVLPKTQGPIYLLTDKSGSMDGEKIRWAKALSIALLMKSRKERRAFYMRFFDSIPHKLVRISRRSRPKEVLELIKELANVGGSGGTDISRALVKACSDIGSGRVRGVSDIVLVTDGEDSVNDSLIKRRLRSSNARLITVMVMGENTDLRRTSDAYLRVLRLTKEEMLKVVEA